MADTKISNLATASSATGSDQLLIINGTIPKNLTINKLVDFIYPVGSIYTSVVSTNPGTLFGTGTWAAFGAGKVMVGLNSGDTDFDVAEEIGGAKTVQSSAQTFAGASSTVAVNHVHVQHGQTSASGGSGIF